MALQKVVTKTLKPFGFCRYQRSSLSVARYGDVLHMLYLAKSRVDDSSKLITGIWHPGLSPDGSMSVIDQIKCFYVGGELSPSGIGHEHWWRNEDLDQVSMREALLEVAIPFLASVSTFDELIDCLQTMGQRDFRKSELSLKIGSASYDRAVIWHQRFDDANFRRVVVEQIGAAVSPLGFLAKSSERQLVFTRERGQFIDVLEPFRSTCGIFMSMRYFVMSPAVWRVRKELKGLFVQTNGSELVRIPAFSSLRAFLLDELGILRDEITALTESQALPFFDSIADRSAFLRALGKGWDSVLRPGLARVLTT